MPPDVVDEHRRALERFYALITLHGKGRASGIELHERAAHELSWRDGKVASLRYTERDG